MSAVDLVAQIIDAHDPGCVVTKFIVIAEVIGPDGDRGVWTEADEEAAPWDTKGLLNHALDELAAQQVVEALHADTDG